MSRIKGVLFDKDGVLVDFDATWGPATVDVIGALADTDDRRRALAEAMDFDLDTARFAPTSVFIAGSSRELRELWEPLLPDIPAPMLHGRLAALYTAAGEVHVAAYPDVAATLTELGAQRLALGVATNDEETSARKQLTKLGLAGRFASVSGADSGHGAKPGPGMLLAFAEHIGAEPAQVVMVGDSTHDMHAARAAGMIAVGIGTGPATLEDLAPHADHAIPMMGDLPGLVASLA